MKSFITLGALVSLLLAPAANATVIWSFYETGISCFLGSCPLPPQPYVFATLSLPSPTSSGAASWGGFPTAPFYTGDDFALSTPATPEPLTPAFSGSSFPCAETGTSGIICNFDISWSATAGDLTSISINLNTNHDNIRLGFVGGNIASQGTGYLGGCQLESEGCRITGFWQSDIPVPEPGSLAMLATSLLGLLALHRLPSRCSAARNGPAAMVRESARVGAC